MEKYPEETVAEGFQKMLRDTGKTGDAWFEGATAMVRALLDKNPRLYRGFGPAWWAVKPLVVPALYDEETQDGALEAFYTYDSDHHTLFAALVYLERRGDTGSDLDPDHPACHGPDGEFDFIANDPAMEF